MKKRLVLAFADVLAPFLAVCCRGAVVAVDFGSPVGPVKPVNGVGQPPMQGLPKKGGD